MIGRGASGTPCDDKRVNATPLPVAVVPEVSRAELVHELRAGRTTLVDVLSPESFATRHIPGAINVPVVDLARRAVELLPDRRARIVTYCGGPT
jgi:rhodanese-related sulfurtransferase